MSKTPQALNGTLRNPLVQSIESLDQSVGALEQQVRKLNQDYDRTAMILAALIELVGDTDVHAKVQELHVRNIELQVTRDRQQVDVLLGQKTIVATDSANLDTDWLVISVASTDGKPMVPSRHCRPLNEYVPEIRDALRGVKVGTAVTFPDGTTVATVTEAFTAAPDEIAKEQAPATPEVVVPDEVIAPPQA